MGKYYDGINKRELRIIIIMIFMVLALNYDFTLGQFEWSDSMNAPYLRFVLSGSSMGHYALKVMIWFLAIYPLLLGAESTIQELHQKTNYILISRVGRRKYIFTRVKNNIKLPVCAIICGLAINFVINYALFHKEAFDIASDIVIESNRYMVWQYAHPYATVLLVSLLYLLVTMLVAIQSSLFAFLFEDRKIVYASSFGLYYFFIHSDLMITSILQPFDEYGFMRDFVPFVAFLITYTIVIVVSYVLVRKKYEEIY